MDEQKKKENKSNNKEFISISPLRYKKLERIEERFEFLMKIWLGHMDANGRRKSLPEYMRKQSHPRLSIEEISNFMIDDEYCKNRYPDEIIFELEAAGK